MEIAVEGERDDILRLLAEFTEMPEHIKFYYLSKLMHKGQDKAKEKEEFKKILSSLSVELVSLQLVDMPCFSGEQHQCGVWKSSARCCGQGQKGFRPNSPGIWVATILAG